MKENWVREVQHLPTLPHVVARLISLFNDERSSAKQLEEIITRDQALTAKLLSVANSSYYGFRYNISTVRRAIVAIGFEETRNICFGASFMRFLDFRKFEDYESAAQLWLHSLAVAVGTRLVAQKVTSLDPGTAFTAGLLHDLGKVVLAAFFPAEQKELKKKLVLNQEGYLEAEASLGMEHGLIGYEVARHWNLPDELAQVMASHHHPDPKSPHAKLVAAVHLADFNARSLGVGESGNTDEPRLEPEAVATLGLGRSGQDDLKGTLKAKSPVIAGMWRDMVMYRAA